jgi:hypothetical protein
MASPDDLDPFALPLRTGRILIAAMVLGATTFLGITLVLRNAGNMPPPPPLPIVSYVGIGFALTILVAYAVVPNQIAATARKQLPREARSGQVPVARLTGLYLTRLIIAAALLESIVFMELIAYLLEGQLFSLGLGAVFLIGLALQFPSRGRVEQWIERQHEILNQERFAG